MKSNQEQKHQLQVNWIWLLCKLWPLVQQGIEYAVKQIKKYKDDFPRTDYNTTIFLLSNLDSTPSAMLTEGSAKELANTLIDEQIELFVA